MFTHQGPVTYNLCVSEPKVEVVWCCCITSKPLRLDVQVYGWVRIASKSETGYIIYSTIPFPKDNLFFFVLGESSLLTLTMTTKFPLEHYTYLVPGFSVSSEVGACNLMNIPLLTLPFQLYGRIYCGHIYTYSMLLWNTMMQHGRLWKREPYSKITKTFWGDITLMTTYLLNTEYYIPFIPNHDLSLD